MNEQELERMYAAAEWRDIKNWCKKNNQTTKYRNKNYYLYLGKIYDDDMNLIIESAENGFLDLYEYFEYFPQPEI